MILEPMTKGQLAAAYKISKRTLIKWMREHKIEVTKGNLLQPKTLSECREKIGDW